MYLVFAVMSRLCDDPWPADNRASISLARVRLTESDLCWSALRSSDPLESVLLPAVRARSLSSAVCLVLSVLSSCSSRAWSSSSIGALWRPLPNRIPHARSRSPWISLTRYCATFSSLKARSSCRSTETLEGSKSGDLVSAMISSWFFLATVSSSCASLSFLYGACLRTLPLWVL